MSTFVEDDDGNQRILLKVDRRYMLFENNGDFIDEIDFECAVEDRI